jgi:hypothetical protein
MNKAVWVIPVFGLIAYACEGTETQNPSASLNAFQDSGCKKETAVKSTTGVRASDSLAAITELFSSTNYSAETSGLKCFAWERTDGNRLKLDLYNFEAACGAEWTGRATVDPNTGLNLTVSNPECLIAKCGLCIYDWSFDVSGIDTNEALPVHLAVDTCPGKQDLKTYSTLLPIHERSSGILCNYADFNALGWQAAALSECGTLGMPCQGTSMCSQTPASTDTTCQNDLVCTTNGTDNESICAKPCSKDEDCGTLGVQKCASGLCRPKENW